MTIDSSLYRPATFIESSFANLGWVLLIGGLLLLLVLGLLFWDWRRLVVSVAAIAVSLAAAVVVLYLRGDTVNLMMTAGLVLGLTAVVYDAVVDPHRVARRLHEARATNPDQRDAPVRGPRSSTARLTRAVRSSTRC